jgi:hypothetical protein
MRSIARALNNIAMSLSKIADAIRAKATINSYQSDNKITTSNPKPVFSKDIWYTSTDQQKNFPNKEEKDLLDKKFQKHKHFPPMENDAISQKIKELGRQDHRDNLIHRLRHAVINDHSKQQTKIVAKHRKEWPSLWSIIDDLVKVGDKHDVK